MKSQTITWWEKTVEYAFIQEHIRIDTMIAPLDGIEERAGDAIFQKDGLWTLIEFKKDEGSISDEKGKYHNFYAAQRDLKNADRHHLLVYGAEVSGKFVLRCRTYFSELVVNLLELDEHGTTLERFKEYLRELLKAKKMPKGSGASSGAGRFSSVVVVNRTGRTVSCLSLEEFEIGLEKTLGKEPEGPSL